MLRAMPHAPRTPDRPAAGPRLHAVSADDDAGAPVEAVPVTAPSPRPAPSPAALEDDALCRRTAAGDEVAFEALVTRYQDRVFAFCLRFLGDRSEAEDVAQDVFLTLYRSASEFRGESAFSTWLLRIAKNQSLNRIKYLDRRGRSGRRSLDELTDERLAKAERTGEEKTPHELVEGGQTAAIVQAAIAELEPEHRAVVVLRDVDDLSYEDISGITGLPIGTVKSRIHRGRSALAERLSRIFR